jgi:hypothetical protein
MCPSGPLGEMTTHIIRIDEDGVFRLFKRGFATPLAVQGPRERKKCTGVLWIELDRLPSRRFRRLESFASTTPREHRRICVG